MTDRALRHVESLLDESRDTGFQRKRSGFRASATKRSASKPTATNARPRNTRPSEVSEDIWELAAQWIEVGTGALNGNRPYVSQSEFAKRFSQRVNADRELIDFRKRFGAENTITVLAIMVDKFWDSLNEGDTDSVHQMQFIRDEWESLKDRAFTAWSIERIRRTGSHKRVYETPTASVDNYAQKVDQQRLARWRQEVMGSVPEVYGGGRDLRERWTASGTAATIANRQKGTTTDEP